MGEALERGEQNQRGTGLMVSPPCPVREGSGEERIHTALGSIPSAS